MSEGTRFTAETAATMQRRAVASRAAMDQRLRYDFACRLGVMSFSLRKQVAAAIGIRLLLGGNALTRWLITLTTVWFAANVLMAPYSAVMRQDLRNLLR